ncbi:MAG: chromophore lyase CpcT/CpeT [Pseudomonadota bacterium]
MSGYSRNGTAGACLTLIAFAACGLAAADDKADPYARDLKVLASWFEGEFDNEEQRWFEADPRSATPESERVLRLHTVHRRVSLPDFGEHVFYVEEYRDNDPAEIIRQRLVLFSAGDDGRGIRMQQGFFRSPEAVRGAHEEPSRLDGLSADDVTFLPQCDVYWQRRAGQFEGSMAPKACVFGDGDERRYSVHDLTLAEDKYWRVDATFLVADDTLFRGYPADRPLQMNRARPYRCDVYFYAPDAAPQVVSDLPMHDQGGTVRAERRSDGATFEVLMRNKEYPYYDTRPDFIYFSLRRAGEQRSLAFSVNDPLSRQLGVRTPEVGAFCHRLGYAFLEPYAVIERNGAWPETP